MYFIKTFAAAGLAVSLLGGCAVVSVASTAVSLGTTAVGAGITVGSAAVSATTTVAKGAVSVAGSIAGSKKSEDEQ